MKEMFPPELGTDAKASIPQTGTGLILYHVISTFERSYGMKKGVPAAKILAEMKKWQQFDVDGHGRVYALIVAMHLT